MDVETPLRPARRTLRVARRRLCLPVPDTMYHLVVPGPGTRLGRDSGDASTHHKCATPYLARIRKTQRRGKESVSGRHGGPTARRARAPGKMGRLRRCNGTLASPRQRAFAPNREVVRPAAPPPIPVTRREMLMPTPAEGRSPVTIMSIVA